MEPRLKACIDNRKKLLNINIFSTCPHNMAHFGPLTAEIDLGVSGTPANFNGFRILPSLLQRRHSLMLISIRAMCPNMERRRDWIIAVRLGCQQIGAI